MIAGYAFWVRSIQYNRMANLRADATGTATISKAGAGPFSKNASDSTTTYY